MNAPVIGLGELLWDIFPDQQRPGGAPANFAFHAKQLGMGGTICSRVGDDSLGNGLLQFVSENGLSAEYIQRDSEHETGRVTVDLSNADHPSFTIHEDAAWDYLTFDAAVEELMSGAAVLCFGTLAQRGKTSRRTIQSCIEAAGDDCRIVYDVNLRPPWYERPWIERSLHAADIVKLNDDESKVLASLFDYETENDLVVAQRLLNEFGVELVCITRGANGCLLVDESNHVELPGIEVVAADPVGAGDAFTAALVFAVTNGWSLRDSANVANQVAALVASCPGAMPAIQDQIAEIVARR